MSEFGSLCICICSLKKKEKRFSYLMAGIEDKRYHCDATVTGSACDIFIIRL